MSAENDPTALWARASLAAALFAVDPVGAVVLLRAPAGAARDAWLAQLQSLLPEGAPMRRAPAQIGDDRLIGGIDITATLRSGRPVAEPGLIAACDGGVLVAAMAERMSKTMAARIASALDAGEVAMQREGFALRFPARIGVVALDEGRLDDAPPPAALVERARFCIDLSTLSHREVMPAAFTPSDVSAARELYGSIVIGPDALESLVAVALRLGVESLRAPLFALQAARALCALRGAATVAEEDLKIAASLVLAPRATQVPADPEAEPEPQAETEREEPPPDSPDDAEELAQTPETLEDVVLAAARAAVPADWLAQVAMRRATRSKADADGRSGATATSKLRGRPMEARAGSPRDGRLSLIATLRAAAPWQKLRAAVNESAKPRRIHVRVEDFRIVRFRQRRGSTTIFALDASGSAAFQRLAEVKGAIELLLADCYVRRDSVALIAFRGKGAELLLPPTRSTARAKRALAGLPGGGGTPIADGIEAATALAELVKRKGQTPLVVLMTDGRANVARDGAGGRVQAMNDALDAGRRLRAAGIDALAIDTSPPSPRADVAPTLRIAEAMQARYVKLPLADASLVNKAVRAATGR